jgi:transposase InsO family protein
MQIHCKYTGVKGFVKLYQYGLKWRYMITNKAKRKAQALSFWNKYGLKAAIDAFGVKERTLYLWKHQLKEGGGKIESLNEKSRRPKNVRKRSWPAVIKNEIKRLREEHPNLGPDKIAALLARSSSLNGICLPKARTVARIIADTPDKMRMFPIKVRHNGQIVKRNRAKKARKPKYFQALYVGHCGAFDTVEKFINGCRRYVLTFTDLYSRFSFALATNSHASQAARDFFTIVKKVFPCKLENILTDNGSEFMKHFDQELRRLCQTHWHTYPKTPKANAHEERFNRTIQEEFIDYHESELLNPAAFNDKLIDYLIWFNGERPHWSLGLKSPIQFLTEQNPNLCKMYWHDTAP